MNLIIQHYFMKQHFLSYLIALLLFPLYEMQAAYQSEFSTAGFYELVSLSDTGWVLPHPVKIR